MDRSERPAVLISRGETVVAFLSVSASAHSIDQLMWVMNPAKLAGISLAPSESLEHHARPRT